MYTDILKKKKNVAKFLQHLAVTPFEANLFFALKNCLNAKIELQGFAKGQV